MLTAMPTRISMSTAAVSAYRDRDRTGFRTTEEVAVFLGLLKEMLVFAGVSNGNMEQGISGLTPTFHPSPRPA